LMAVLIGPWNMPPPSALISILENPATTGGKDAPLTEAQILNLESGIRLATKLSNAWVLTDGVHPMDCDVRCDGTSAVARAVNGTGMPCIGIAPSRCVADTDILSGLMGGKIHCYSPGASRNLASEESSRQVEANAVGREGVHARVSPDEPNATLNATGPGIRYELDDSLSHVILVDDGTPSVEATVPIRTRLETHITSLDFSNDSITTPLVLLVIRGDIKTLRDVHHRLSCQQPVVILTDTGGVCESIHHFHESGELPAVAGTGGGASWVAGAA